MTSPEVPALKFLTENQTNLLRMAFDGLVCLRLEFLPGRGSSFGDFVYLNREDRESVSNWIRDYHPGSGANRILAFQNEGRDYIVAENALPAWSPVNIDAQWPPNRHVLTLLAAKAAPHVRKSKGYFSDRNVGILGLIVGASLMPHILQFGWLSFLCIFMLLYGVFHLGKYYWWDKYRYNKRRLKILEATMQEDIGFSAQETENVIPLGKAKA